jgi:hypothetical protein
VAKRFVVLLVLTGCRQILGLEPLPRGDAGADVSVEKPDAMACFGTLARACIDTSGAQDLDLRADIDTDKDPSCIAVSHPGESPDLCVILGANVHVESINVTGDRALVIVALGDVAVMGHLDASSQQGTRRGAGAGMCASGNGMVGLGGGGGAGGSFGGVGGAGGSSLGSNGGMALPVQPVTNVHGGCAGGHGGGGVSMGGAAGDGGGAISIVSTTRIQVNGEVLANGAGGGGGGSSAGGGGGGSGGLIALEAPALDVFGQVIANSGGGGEGGVSGAGNGGSDGQTQFDKAANGGSGTTAAGGDGGDGTAVAIVDGAAGMNGASSPGAGAGGGGGGAGVVWVKGTLNGTRISPTPEIH